MFKYEMAGLLLPNPARNGKYQGKIDIAQFGIRNSINNLVAFCGSGLIFFCSDTQQPAMPGKIFIEKRNPFLSAQFSRQKRIRNYTDNGWHRYCIRSTINSQPGLFSYCPYLLFLSTPSMPQLTAMRRRPAMRPGLVCCRFYKIAVQI